MGNVSSRPDDGAALFLSDQNRCESRRCPCCLRPCPLRSALTRRSSPAVSIASLVISNTRKRTSIIISPNAFPATRVSASRPAGDNAPVEFIQVRPPTRTASPSLSRECHATSRPCPQADRPVVSSVGPRSGDKSWRARLPAEAQQRGRAHVHLHLQRPPDPDDDPRPEQ